MFPTCSTPSIWAPTGSWACADAGSASAAAISRVRRAGFRTPTRNERSYPETCADGYCVEAQAAASSSSFTRKDEPQPQEATTFGFCTSKPEPIRLSV